MNKIKDIRQRFMKNVFISASGCWEWRGGTTTDGYGSFSIRDKTIRAHRASLVISGIELKSEDVILHKCDNIVCVNPDHLKVGTTQDNIDDRVAKGRSAKGEKNGRSKLSAEAVRKIIIEIESGKPKSIIASENGVCRRTILDIQTGKLWKDIPRPIPLTK